MDEKIIKRIELDIDGVGINLTPEQARKLHGALAELLGIKPEVITVKEKEYIPSPYPVPQPYYVPAKPWRRPWYDEPYIRWTCDAVATNIGGLNATYNNNAGSVKLLVQ